MVPLRQTKASIRHEDSAARAYDKVRQMAIEFKLRPGERINEKELAKSLNVSRTPLRAALNRLASEGFLRSVFNRGFYCRSLEIQEVFDLYELRCETEISALRLACQRATDDQIAEFERLVETRFSKFEGMKTVDIVRVDEEFHEGLAGLSGNAEIVHLIQSINARIRFVRWVDMERRVAGFDNDHNEVVAALRARDAATGEKILRRHISRRVDQIVDVIKAGVAHIYVGAQLVDAQPEPRKKAG
jgi:DNA-binding GntR family transcriptional regulator